MSIIIKSILRNKSNRIYIFVFCILFFILNFMVNVNSIVDNFYDTKINIAEEFELTSRTLYIEDNIDLSEQDINNILHMEHVEDFFVEKKEYGELEFSIKTIIVNNWKNCQDIINKFDENGVKVRRQYGGITFDNLVEQYHYVKNILKVIIWVAYIICICMFTISYKNIINNEKVNLKMLNVFGYTNMQLNILRIMSLLVLTSIGFILGYGIKVFILSLLNLSLKIGIWDIIRINFYSVLVVTISLVLNCKINIPIIKNK